MEKTNYFSLAMDLSNNMFAFHLCGVLTHLSNVDGLAPDPEAEALGYLKTFHPEALEEDEPSEDWDDESALASAGFGMDESYAHGEDFGYFGEAGLWD